MAHVAKYSKSACGHMCAHYERRINDNGEYVKFGNESIDSTRTHLNYNLTSNDKDQIEFIRNRCAEVKCLKRNDVKVMCSWVVTLPKDFPGTHEDNFFKETYDFLEDKYGKENVVSAYVHKDEVTPHMHFAFVPVVHDPKKDIDKISAKERITRQDLKSFHGELESHLEQRFNFKINILNESTKEGNIAIKELKKGTAIEKVEQMQSELKSIEHEIMSLTSEYEAKKAYISTFINQEVLNTGVKEKTSITGKIKAYQLTPKKWEEVQMTYMDKVASSEMKNKAEETLNKFKDSNSYKVILDMQKEIKDLKVKNRKITQKYKSSIQEIEKVFEKYPKLKKLYIVAEKEMKQERKINKGFNLER